MVKFEIWTFYNLNTVLIIKNSMQYGQLSTWCGDLYGPTNVQNVFFSPRIKAWSLSTPLPMTYLLEELSSQHNSRRRRRNSCSPLRSLSFSLSLSHTHWDSFFRGLRARAFSRRSSLLFRCHDYHPLWLDGILASSRPGIESNSSVSFPMVLSCHPAASRVEESDFVFSPRSITAAMCSFALSLLRPPSSSSIAVALSHHWVQRGSDIWGFPSLYWIKWLATARQPAN